MRWAGIRILTQRPAGGIRRHCQVLPGFGDRDFIVSRPPRWYLVRWKKWYGYHVLAVAPAPRPLADPVWTWLDSEDSMPIRRSAVDPATLVPPDLPTTTKIFTKLPLLVQFLAARSYEGGGARLPGKLWLEGGSLGYAVTLIDTDQCMRLVVRAGTLDDVLAAAELLLGADSAPWEPDQFALERAQAKKKKK